MIFILVFVVFSISLFGYPIMKTGTVQHLEAEDVFEFEDTDGNTYILSGVEDRLSSDEVDLLKDNPDTQYAAKMVGWVRADEVTPEQSSRPVDLWSLILV